MNFVSELKCRLFPKGIRKTLQKCRRHVFERTAQKDLVECFTRLGLPKDAVVCIHSMLSGLGYLVGGPGTVIDALLKAVPGATLMMPTFPFDNTTIEYLAGNPVYHINNTPSKSGLLSETLRLTAGAKRSYHPTHPCVALGPKANFLIDGTEKSETPFGDNSTYGRFSTLDNAFLLLIHTNNTSMVHRVQEMVNMPNLFFGERFIARGVDPQGNLAEYSLKAHIPVLPLYLVAQGQADGEREYIWFPDYALLFPQYNRERILSRLQSASVKEMLMERHRDFLNHDVYRIVKHGNAEIATVRVGPWLERLCGDIRQSLNQFKPDYQYQNMEAARRRGLLSKYKQNQ